MGRAGLLTPAGLPRQIFVTEKPPRWLKRQNVRSSSFWEVWKIYPSHMG